MKKVSCNYCHVHGACVYFLV